MNVSNEISAKLNSILEENDLAFTILKEPMKAMFKDELVETGYFALINDKSGETLNSVKEGYTVSQNDEIVLAALLGIEPFEHELSVSNAGAINGGRKIFIQLEVAGKTIMPDNDVVTRYITIIDSNDGSTGLSIGVGTLTMSCQNQFWKFYKSGSMKARHTQSIEEKIKALPNLITEAIDNSLDLTEKFKIMHKVKADKNLIDGLVNHLVGADYSMTTAQLDETPTRRLNTMNALYKHIKSEMSTKGQNLWGLHSGITSWTTHERKTPNRVNGKIESIMMGTNQKTASKALTFLEDYMRTQEELVTA